MTKDKIAKNLLTEKICDTCLYRQSNKLRVNESICIGNRIKKLPKVNTCKCWFGWIQIK